MDKMSLGDVFLLISVIALIGGMIQQKRKTKDK
jgi:hypothetical protein